VVAELTLDNRALKDVLSKTGSCPYRDRELPDSGEHRHREPWPAYNLNLASPQASTEGLFQQTQALTLKTPRAFHGQTD